MANYQNPQNPLSKCTVYTIQPSACDCILILEDTIGRQKRIPLRDAYTYPIMSSDGSGEAGFMIQAPTTGAKVSGSSVFTQDDIDDLICACQFAGSGGEVPNSILPDRKVLTGADSWVIPSGLQSVAYFVSASGNAGVTPTMTTTDGTSALLVGEQGGFSVVKDHDTEIIAPLTITTSINDVVVITWTV